MRDDTRREREDQIAAAAYSVLAEKGYGGASMLAIARAAKASNETMYRWYGDKAGLFTRLIERNAEKVVELLSEGQGQDPLSVLAALGPRLLQLLTSDRAIALNRAAAADPTGELGAALTRAGRESVAPLIAGVLARAHAQGLIDAPDAPDASAATGLYLDLLIGDLQIRRVIGAVPAPSQAECWARAAHSLDRFLSLMAPAPA